MNTPRTLSTPLAIIAAMLAVSAWAWYVLPADARIPVHFNLHLQPDRLGGKLEGLLVLPVIVALLACGPMIARRVDPRAHNLVRAREAVRVAVFAVISGLACIHLAVVGEALDWPIALPTALTLSLSLMLVIMGNVLGKVGSNHFLGIRTTWTLADEQVWGKTHRFAGRGFVAVGLLGGAIALGGDASVAGTVVISGLLATSLLSVLLSWIWWRRLVAGKSS